MKKLLFLFFLFSSFSLVAQDIKEFSELMTEGGNIKACKAIVLLPGFSFMASQGNSLMLSVDPNVCTLYVEHPVALSTNQNYILSVTPLDATDSISVSNGKMIAARDARFLASVQYFDGLGRPTQTVQRQITPDKKDLISLSEYDGFGREWKSYLPYPKTNNNGAYHVDLGVNQIKTAYEGDFYPYNETVYESSPLNRVEKKYGEGQEWRINSHGGNPLKINHLISNAEYPCYRYSVGANGFKREGTYNKKLYVTELIDEDGNLSYEFRNNFDDLLLVRQIDHDGVKYDTYYVYDDRSQKPSYIIPPILSDRIPTSSGIVYSDTLQMVQDYAYIYKYDSHKRCISKKIPGAEAIYYVYDKADQLILVQDGEQRLKSPEEWTFNKYDVMGRLVITGICSFPNMNVRDLRSTISNQIIRESFDKTRPSTYYYTDNSDIKFSNYIRKVETVNYYDNYQFKSLTHFNNNNFAYATPNGFENKRFGTDTDRIKSKGFLTGSLTAISSNNSTTTSFLASVYYYDNKGRLIQSHSSNHLNGYDNEYTNYSFAGQPTWNMKQHTSKYQPTPLTEVYTYTYDHADRLKETRYKIDNDPEIVLSEITYNDLGQAIQKKETQQPFNR